MLKFKFKHPDFSDQQLNRSITKILETNKLLSMATVKGGGKAYNNTAFFAFDDTLSLYIMTDPSAQHSKNVKKNNSVVVTVFDSHQGFWTELKGLQLFGKCRKTPKLRIPHAFQCFVKRYPVFKEYVKKSTDMLNKEVEVSLYTIEIGKIKLFDEPSFGEEIFIELKI